MRIVDVVDDAGNTSTINVYPSTVTDLSDIIVAGYGNLCRDKALVSELRPALDKALLQILEWVKQAGFTRTPV